MNAAASVWIDTDVSIGLEHFPGFYKDIDDALAMIALFNSPLVEVRGVSSTFGNTGAKKAYAIARELVEKFGPKGLQVHLGAEQAIAKGHLPESDASWAMADALRQAPMTIMSIGSATNVAVLIASHPELVDRIQGIVAMAGARRTPGQDFFVGPRQIKPFTALNFEADVEAWRIILASNVPITFADFEVCHQVWLTEDDARSLEHAGNTGSYLAPHMRRWAREWREFYGSPGFNPFDALAAGYLLAPEFFTAEELPVGILEPGQGGNPRDVPCLIISDAMGSNHRVTYLSAVNQGFTPFLMELLKGGFSMCTKLLAFSHINIVVDDIEKATEFYGRTLGFQMAYNTDGAIDFQHYKDAAFARDAGFLDGVVDVDVRFLRHPQAGLCLELMRYHAPQGSQEIKYHPTNELGGPRHIALEVTDIQSVFEHLKSQPDVRMVSTSKAYGPPETLGMTGIAFFYWLDPYGVQWEMEQGRPIGYGREIAG